MLFWVGILIYYYKILFKVGVFGVLDGIYYNIVRFGEVIIEGKRK